ncbi:hypothetical protein [Campylobacter hominis]
MPFLIGIVSALGSIVAFLGKWLVSKAEALPSFLLVLFINVSMLSLFLLYIFAITKLVYFVYQQINKFVNFLNTASFGVGGEISDLIYNMLVSARFFDALADVTNIFMPFISSVILIIAYHFGIIVFKTFRETVLSLVVSKLT